MPKILSPTEWRSWQELTGEQVRREEWAVLRDMDHAYTGALAEELSDQRAREAESKSNGRHR